MPEVVKQYITFHDIKLVIAVVSIMLSGFVAWSGVREDLRELQVRREVEAEKASDQVEAIKALTEAVQTLNITSVQLGERLRNLEKMFSDRIK